MKTTRWTDLELEVAMNDVVTALLDRGAASGLRLATITGHEYDLVCSVLVKLEIAGLVEFTGGALYTYADCLEYAAD